jgi:hypothetical protein
MNEIKPAKSLFQQHNNAQGEFPVKSMKWFMRYIAKSTYHWSSDKD